MKVSPPKTKEKVGHNSMTRIALFFVVFQDLYCCLGQNSTLEQLSVNVLCKQSPRNIEKTDDKKNNKLLTELLTAFLYHMSFYDSWLKTQT